MTVTAPVRDIKNTSAFVKLVEQEGEVIVTKNGYDVMHCISSDQQRINEEAIAKSRLLSRILLAEEQIASGNYSHFDTFTMIEPLARTCYKQCMILTNCSSIFQIVKKPYV